MTSSYREAIVTDDPFRRFRCWNTSEVQRTIFGDIAWLGLDADAVFLAAHTSLDIEHVRGVRQPGAEREVAVLRALDSSFGRAGQNTLIAITGPSGSGKSHLVRWVRAQLSETADSYHLIYVPKALETLRELLGHILDRMPGDESDVVKAELDKAVGQKRPEQLAEELLDRLRSVLSYELPAARQGHDAEMRRFLLGTRVDSETARREGGLADLLLIKPVRDHLLRPDGAIVRMVDSVRGRRRGDEETPEFVASDFPTKQAGTASQLRGPLLQLWSLLSRDASPAIALLNEARNRAVAEALGMRAGVNLGEVFAKTRRRLRSESKELVLLFEDLAQFGLFDGDLYDHFAIQPGDELAPIRAIFAITDGKFEVNVPDTVRTRLTHQFRVGELTLRHGSPADDAAIVVSKYLNVARVGRDRLIKAWLAASPDDRESARWVPNACFDLHGDGRECVNREECWSAFGEVDQVGLYPYGRIALRRELQKRGSSVTARALVDETVKEFLVEADPAIGGGSFPGAGVKDRFDFGVSRAKESIVPSGTLSETERDRLHRARVIWADGGLESSGITVAFDLPTSAGTEVPPVEPQLVAPEPKATKPSPLVPLFAWQNGEEMLEAEAIWYRERLLDLVSSRVDLAAMLIDPGPGHGQVVLGRVLGANSFELTRAPGQRAGQNRLRFAIGADDAGVLLLSAVRWWWDHGHWDMNADDRKWDFPLDSAKAQIALDEFLDSAVRDTEGAIVAVLTRGPLDPAAAAVGLRASAVLALGHGPATAAKQETLDWVLGGASSYPFRPSPTWEHVARESLKILSDIDAGWLAAFASARQGDTGEPLCVDAARLLPAALRAAEDPLSLLEVHPNFDDAFSELALHWEALEGTLRSGIDAEAETLAEALEAISQHLVEADFDLIVRAVASAGRFAADNNVFRPANQYGAFRDACDRLAQDSGSDVAAFLGARPAFASGRRDKRLADVLDAQRWAANARRVRDDLDLVASCLDTTQSELTQRLIEDLGVTPQAAASAARTKVDAIAAALQAVFEQEGVSSE
jgi:hypothetical protein